MRRSSVFALGASIAACNAPLTVMSAQQTAQDFNMDARFARGEVPVDRIDPAERDEFAAHHREWGSSVRLADMELAGSRPHGQHDVDIFVRFAWYRTDDEELHYTTVKQDWHDKGGNWILVAEQRSDGDIGLLGERVVYETPSSERRPAMFPTVRIGAE